MGTEYALVRDDNQTMFNLGKWSLYGYSAEPAMLPDDIADGWATDPYCAGLADEYVNEVAARVQAFADGHPVRWVCDARGTEMSAIEQGNRYVATRYAARWAPEGGYGVVCPFCAGTCEGDEREKCGEFWLREVDDPGYTRTYTTAEVDEICAMRRASEPWLT